MTGTLARPHPPIALVFSVTAIAIMGNSLIAPLVPDIVRDLDVGDGAAGIIISAVALPGIVMAPIVGVLADRLGRRRVLVPCLVAFGVAGVLVAAAPTFPLLLAGRFLQGIGAAGLINLAVVIIGDHWDGTERTRLIGRNASMLTVGLATFPLLAGGIAELSSWRIALLPQAAGLVIAAIAWRVLDDHGAAEVAVPLRAQLSGLGTVIRRPSILAVFGSGFVVFVLIFGVFLATLPLHLEREFGLGAGGRGFYLSIPAVTATLVAFNLGRITGRWGRRPVLVGATVVFVVSFTMMGLAPALWTVALACALYGLGDGALIPILQDTAVTEAPADQRGAVVAVWVGFARLGQTVGPLAAAAVFTATSTTTALLVGGAVAAMLLALVMAGPLGRAARVNGV